MNFKRYKKILIGSMSAVALLAVSMAKTPEVYANEATGKLQDKTITSRVIPSFAASTTVGYDVGSDDYVDITLWIDGHKGGSEYSSLGYCDFYAKDSAMQTIVEVSAYGDVCSHDGKRHFDLERHVLEMD